MTVAEQREQSIELDIGGMTCASCVARVEKRLNRMDGVSATVNFATETAHVVHPPDVTTEDLIAQVEAAGYTASLPMLAAGMTMLNDADDRETRSWRDRFIVSAVLTAPVVLLAM